MKTPAVMIGAGRVATHLAQALRERAGLRLVQVYSRTAEHARALAEGLDGTAWTTSAEAVRTDADVYVFSLSDDALADVAIRVPTNNGLRLHTAGASLRRALSAANLLARAGGGLSAGALLRGGVYGRGDGRGAGVGRAALG